MQRILPRIRNEHPDATLTIVGRIPDRLERYLRTPGVHFTSFIEDISSAYEEARIVVCPISSGSGTRVKICEAAAYGRPVAVGAEGLDFVDGQHLFVRDDDEEFAAACSRLCSDWTLAETMGNAARERAAELYDRPVIAERASNLVSDALRGIDQQWA